MHYESITLPPVQSDHHNRVSDMGTVRFHRVPILGKIAAMIFAATTLIYFMVRIPLWNPESPFLSSILLAAELFGTLTLVLHVITTWCLVEHLPPPPAAGCSADILITTWNEPAQILRHTLLAAKNVRRVGKIWLLDDGCRPEMEALAAELGVEYLARTDRSHAKAGNINHALGHVTADFVALFDCDHAPAPDFLERTLGYFIDPGIAFVQTPQDFYNVDSFQHRTSSAHREAWHEQTLFYRVIQAGKYYWNSTFFCGSCAVLRTSALADIGGIATGTITEDMHTSLRFHKRGWSAAYHAEALAFGLSPMDIEQYEVQRLRWGRGAMQVWRKERILTTQGLSFAQRIAYFTSAVTYFEGWQKCVIYVMPIIVLATGWLPIIWKGWAFLGIFFTWLLSGMLVNEIFSRGYSKTVFMEEYNFLRFFTFMKAAMALVIPIDWKFSVTPKTARQSRDGQFRLWPQMLVVTASLAAVPFGLYRYNTSPYLPFGAFLTNIAWVLLSAGIGIKSLSFVRNRLGQRRSDHRFALPLAARLELGGERSAVVIAEDVSSSGFGFRFSSSEPLGKVLHGTIALPGHDLPFIADIVQMPSTTGERYAVQFRWPRPADADPLDACLYGNSMQWDVNGWLEVEDGGLGERLAKRLMRKPIAYVAWQRARLVGAGRSVDCVARREGDCTRLVLLEPLPATSDLALALVAEGDSVTNSAFAADLVGLQVAGYRQYPVPNGTFHMALLVTAGSTSTFSFHREPAWTRDKEAA